jgi:hypothetical protein
MMASFGNSYRLNETARRLVEDTLNRFYDAVRNGTHNGFCDLGGLPNLAGSTWYLSRLPLS